MKQFLARVVETESVPPDLFRIVFAGNEFPPCQSGQFFLVRQDSPYFDPYLRRVWFAPRVKGNRVEFCVSESRTLEWLTRRIDFIGPLGHGFQIPREKRHLVVVGENARCAAPLIGLIELLAKDEERELLVVCGEPALPEILIPPQVEYRVHARTFEAVGGAWEWGEFAIASGTRAFYEEWKRSTPRSLPMQGLISDLPLPCGVGACCLCPLDTREGFKLVCRDGPVFDL